MNESRSFRAFEDVAECHGSKLHGPGIEIFVPLHFSFEMPKLSSIIPAPLVDRPKFHPLAALLNTTSLKIWQPAILHVSGKRIDADPSPTLLFERFVFDMNVPSPDPTSRKNPFLPLGKTVSDTHAGPIFFLFSCRELPGTDAPGA